MACFKTLTQLLYLSLLTGLTSAQCMPMWTDVSGLCMQCQPSVTNFVNTHYQCRWTKKAFLGVFVNSNHTEFAAKTCGFSHMWIGILASGSPTSNMRWISGEPTVPFFIRNAGNASHGICVSATYSTQRQKYDFQVETNCATIRPFLCTMDYITCPELDDPTWGTVTYSASVTNAAVVSGTVATYSCDNGYGLHGGNIKRSCLTTGYWDGAQPICSHCQALDVPENGFIEYNSSNVTVGPTGDEIALYTVGNYSCTNGTSLVLGDSSRQCESTGIWSGSEPKCVYCIALDVPLHATISYSDLSVHGKYPVLTNANHTCNVGYNLTSGSEVRACNESAQWDGTKPLCIPVNCSEPSPPINGTVHYASTTYGSQAINLCNTSYSITGIVARYCDQHGHWTSGEAKCEAEGLTLPVGVGLGVPAGALGITAICLGIKLVVFT